MMASKHDTALTKLPLSQGAHALSFHWLTTL